MSHVNWWLFGLSFAIGFVLTFASMVRPVRRQAPMAVEPSTTRIVADPPTTKIPVRKEFPTTKIPVSPLAPYGPGSANPGPDGSGPPGWLVKGRMDTQLYYTPDDPAYDATAAQVWFIDEEAATGARFMPWRRR